MIYADFYLPSQAQCVLLSAAKDLTSASNSVEIQILRCAQEDTLRLVLVIDRVKKSMHRTNSSTKKNPCELLVT